MTDLIINPNTKKNIDFFLKNPSHAVLFHGQKGLGVDVIAFSAAKKLAGNKIQLITPDENGKILVDAIRDNVIKIINNTQKTPLAVVISNADVMNIWAQNSLLKVLEEPVNNVYFILSAHQMEKLLPTVCSRTQMIEIMPVPLNETAKLLENAKITADKRTKIAFLAGGKPAETLRLLNDEQYYRNMASLAESAKKFISGDTYEKLKIISGIKKRDEATDFVQTTASLLLFLSKSRKIPNLAENLEVIEVIDAVLNNLHQNGNVKAQLTYLATNL